MNRDVILQVADQIEALPPGAFNMGSPCGCIASLMTPTEYLYRGPSLMAAEFGIPPEHADAMYYCYGYRGSKIHHPSGWPNQQHTARMLRNYVETGVVDWEGTKP